MKVTFDETGYVNGWCMVGDNGGEEYDPPEDFDRFLDSFESFKLADGKLVFDSEKDDTNRLESEKASLRERREKECFSVVNRGWIWYSTLRVDLVFDPDAQPVAGTAELVHRVAEGDGNHDSARAPIMGR